MAIRSSTRKQFAGAAVLNNATAVDIVDPGTTKTVWLTKATLSITTHANGKLAQLQDSSGSPVVFCKHIDATAAAGVPSVVTWDFGDHGVPLTLGKKLQAVSEALGVSGIFYAEGYIR